MDSSQPGSVADSAAEVMTVPPTLTVVQATLFVADFSVEAAELENRLGQTLDRLQVIAGKQRVIALAEQPLLGRHSLVRVTPCLVLDTGSREVRITGDIELLDARLLEAALARQ